MANEGGHGGSSNMEIITPALFISSRSDNSIKNNVASKIFFDTIQVHEQVDLVSTICCL